jgi:hypothetical protein
MSCKGIRKWYPPFGYLELFMQVQVLWSLATCSGKLKKEKKYVLWISLSI